MIWFLAFLACYRLTRLITGDEITKALREKAFDRSRWFGYLISCDWCLSIWIAPFVAFPVILWPDNRLLLAVLLGLALSAVTGLLSVIESRIDR
jgi:hypothetical protein